MKIGGAIMVKRIDLLGDAVSSLLNVVDKVFVGVDIQADPSVYLSAVHMDVSVGMFSMNGFASVMNWMTHILHEDHGCDWILHLDADETIEERYADAIRQEVKYAHEIHADAFRFARHNWTDLGRLNQRKDLWPDWQARLHRWDVRYRWRSHPEIDPVRYRVVVSQAAEIHHYCFALRSPEEWGQVNRFYGEMLRRDIQDGRVWQGDPRAIVDPVIRSLSPSPGTIQSSG